MKDNSINLRIKTDAPELFRVVMKSASLTDIGIGYQLNDALKGLSDAAKAYSEVQIKNLKEDLKKMEEEENKVKKFKYVPARLNDEDVVTTMISGAEYYSSDGKNKFFFEKGFFKVFNKLSKVICKTELFPRGLYKKVECKWYDDLDSVKLPVLIKPSTGLLEGVWLVETKGELESIARSYKESTLLTKEKVKILLENAPE